MVHGLTVQLPKRWIHVTFLELEVCGLTGRWTAFSWTWVTEDCCGCQRFWVPGGIAFGSERKGMIRRLETKLTYVRSIISCQALR